MPWASWTPKETRAVEALLESSPEARVALEEIRATAALLTAEFSKEPSLSLHDEQVEAITGEGKIVHTSFFSKHRNFLSMGAVAACAVLFAAIGLKPYLAGLESEGAATMGAVATPTRTDEVGQIAPGAGQAGALGDAGEPTDSPSPAALAADEEMDSDGAEEMEKAVAGRALAEVGERRQLPKENAPAIDSVAAKSEAPASAAIPSAREAVADPTPSADAVAPMPAPARTRSAGATPKMATDEFAAGSDGAALAPAEPAGGVARGKQAKARAMTRASASMEKLDRMAIEEKLAPSVLEAEVLDDAKDESFGLQRARRKPVADVAGGESYGQLIDNPWVTTWDDGLSTFAIDVDTGTYPNLRRFLKRRASLPPKDAVRIEEMINYFDYDYPEPQGDVPFSVSMEVASCPWAKDHRLLRVGLRGKGVELAKRPPSNLVFLIDVSGSMRGDDKLELLKRSMKAMVGQLNEDDRIGIVTYAGNSGVVLEPTHGDQKGKIIGVLDQLGAGGSTNGAAGINTAYSLAKANFVEGGTNRVILATDGDFNVGVTDSGDLVRMVEERARENVFLTVLGVGEGNLQEHRMEQIADKGNGSYHYLDSEREGEKVLVRGLGATLVTVAKDVKVQIDFNPAQVAKYRLIGYANRMMPDEAFNDPAADAGEIGAGHTVTALYEIVPAAAGVEPGAATNAVSRYRERGGLVESRESLTLKLKYKLPEGDDPEPTIEVPLIDAGKDWAETSEDFRFAAAVAGFGLLLRDSDYAGLLNYDLVLELGAEGIPEKGDGFGLRAEFIDLVKIAKSLPR